MFDPGRPRQMNRKLNRFLNYYEIKAMVEAVHPNLKKAWCLKDDVVDFYDYCTYDPAPQALNKLIQAFAASGIPEMKEFSRTLISWREEIINSFNAVNQRHTVDKDTGQMVVSDIKLNNGLMENRNSTIKTIKKSANGYTNWDRFRSRCLYVLRKSSKPMLNPVIPPKKVKQ